MIDGKMQMAKWVDRAKRIIGNQGVAQFRQMSLNKVVEQGVRIVEDIRFVMETSGTLNEVDLELTSSGLNCVEAFYRSAVKSETQIEHGLDNFERLMAVMLGQTIVATKNGLWVVYGGRYRVFDPIVVRLSNEKHVDVFMFCKSLSQKSGVSGAKDGHALSSFVENVERMAFP